MSDQERLVDLFRGLDRAHGIAKPTGKKSARGKSEVRYQTKREPITAEAWDLHIKGEVGLVITPIRDDGNVCFGAIDVDVYPLDLEDLSKRIAAAKLPLVPCRTKSGGAHLYVFFSEPVNAELAQERLLEWAVALGYPNSEVFPKQTSLASEADMGNGINVPYFGGERSMRYAVGSDGKALKLTNFLDLAESLKINEDDLRALEARPVSDDLEGAPPCLQHWATAGVGEGQRNDVMFDFAIFARKRWPDNWQSRFEEFNRRYCDPPLPATEVVTIIKSVAKAKDYTYKAKCEGPFCNPQLCRKKDFGRGGGYDESNVVVDNLTIVMTEPKTFYVNVNGKSVELTSSQFINQQRFILEVLEQTTTLMRPLKPRAWYKLRENLLANATMIEAPDDASPRGQLSLYVSRFVDQNGTEDRDKLRAGHVWLDTETNRAWFRSQDFMEFLKRNRVQGWTPRDVFNVVRDYIGGNTHVLKMDGKPNRYWWVPYDPAGRDDDKELPIPDLEPRDDVPF